jgi:hypothetical protein
MTVRAPSDSGASVRGIREAPVKIGGRLVVRKKGILNMVGALGSLPESLQFSFQLGDAFAQWSRNLLDLYGGVARGDELRAVSVIAEASNNAAILSRNRARVQRVLLHGGRTRMLPMRLYR